LAKLTVCVLQRTLRNVQTVTIVMILHMTQWGGSEYWESVTGLNWLQLWWTASEKGSV